MVDRLGESGISAAEWVEVYSLDEELFDDEVKVKLRLILARGIREMRGADGTGRLIRRELPDLKLSVREAKAIATYEIASAFSFAAIEKMKSLRIEFKRLSIAWNCCDICWRDYLEGPVPISQAFPSGKMRTPIHKGCRCATVAAQKPST